jgi:hypothetical protein
VLVRFVLSAGLYVFARVDQFTTTRSKIRKRPIDRPSPCCRTRVERWLANEFEQLSERSEFCSDRQTTVERRAPAAGGCDIRGTRGSRGRGALAPWSPSGGESPD